MYIVKRQEYNPKVDLAEGDLVKLEWDDRDEYELGIVTQVIIDVRNDDHLTLSEEVLMASVLICGQITYFDEDELVIVEKCNS
tara:strand:+ start:559 stop:807 length:249 start_codon:yes stop_codon:yes gene_type:complete